MAAGGCFGGGSFFARDGAGGAGSWGTLIASGTVCFSVAASVFAIALTGGAAAGAMAAGCCCDTGCCWAAGKSESFQIHAAAASMVAPPIRNPGRKLDFDFSVFASGF